MADEWVGVRARLAKDGKTISMTNFLLNLPEFQEWIGVTRGVTLLSLPRNVLLSVTIKALIEVWAVGNSRGIVDGDDVLLSFTQFDTIDEIAEVPGFSKAMAMVHWLDVHEIDGVSAVRLPNFKEYNRPAESRDDDVERIKKQNRERQRKLRERRHGESRDVTLHHAPKEQNITGQDITGQIKDLSGDRDARGRGEVEPVLPDPIHFNMVWQRWPAGGRAKIAGAKKHWLAAIQAIAARDGGDHLKAAAWLEARILEYLKSPKAKKFLSNISNWLEQGRYDDAAEAWQMDDEEEQPESQYHKLKPVKARAS